MEMEMGQGTETRAYDWGLETENQGYALGAGTGD